MPTKNRRKHLAGTTREREKRREERKAFSSSPRSQDFFHEPSASAFEDLKTVKPKVSISREFSPSVRDPKDPIFNPFDLIASSESIGYSISSLKI